MSTPFLATPEGVVEALSRAFSERRWREVARYLDKASVNEFHRWQSNWYALFDYVLATAGNRVMMYEEVRPDDTAPPDDGDGAAARR